MKKNLAKILGIVALVMMAASAHGEPPSGYFKLQSAFLEQNDKCLEGNRVSSESYLGGASFMDRCQSVTGQMWKAVPAGNGYFFLMTRFLEGENKCLEGSKPFAARDPLKGAARMDDCGNFSGQMWKLIPQNNGYVQLTNRFLEAENRCLESSRPSAPNDPLYGAARMDPCGNFSGQMWKMIPVAVRRRTLTCDVGRAPIWNHKDAQGKCPSRCARIGANWTGHWTSPVQGAVSVCNCANVTHKNACY